MTTFKPRGSANADPCIKFNGRRGFIYKAEWTFTRETILKNNLIYIAKI